MSSGAAVAVPRRPARLRREWTFVTLGGFFLLALLALYSDLSLLGALPVWTCCAALSYRGLTDNHREDDRSLFVSLGVPTLVTLVRGFLVAVAAGFLLVPWVVAPLYSVAAILDHVDGRLARGQRRTTRLGSRLDMEVDALGILVASVAGIVLGKLPLWYLAVGLARYFFVAGSSLRRHRGASLRELDPSALRRILAGCQMGFLAVSLWPPIPPSASFLAAYLFGGATLAMFCRDWRFVSRDSRALPRTE